MHSKCVHNFCFEMKMCKQKPCFQSKMWKQRSFSVSPKIYASKMCEHEYCLTSKLFKQQLCVKSKMCAYKSCFEFKICEQKTCLYMQSKTWIQKVLLFASKMCVLQTYVLHSKGWQKRKLTSSYFNFKSHVQMNKQCNKEISCGKKEPHLQNENHAWKPNSPMYCSEADLHVLYKTHMLHRQDCCKRNPILCSLQAFQKSCRQLPWCSGLFSTAHSTSGTRSICTLAQVAQKYVQLLR